MSFHRRTLLKAGLAGLVASYGLRSRALAFRAPASPGKRLVILIMRGGYDGLSMAIPYTNPVYIANRQLTGYGAGEVLKLDAGYDYGFHPRLTKFKDLWDGGSLALFHQVGQVGNPSISLSHFTNQDIWGAGRLTDHSSGWIGRWAELTGFGSTGMIGMGTSNIIEFRTSPGAVSPPQPLLMSSVGAFQVPPHTNHPYDTGLRTAAAQLTEELNTSQRPVVQCFSGASETAYQLVQDIQDGVADYVPGAGVVYPSTGFGAQMQDIARLVHAEGAGAVCPNVYVTLTGGFDTHDSQRSRLDARWADVNDSIAALMDDLGPAKLSTTTFLLFTEFGRRNAENGSGATAGTDHGEGNSMVAFGGAVAGGHYGDVPTSADLSLNNLPATADFRDPFRVALEQFMGVDPVLVKDIFDEQPAGTPLPNYFL